ncbi:MAG: YraN family protein [Firmicutes bacterium]|nr:YraN family protein [Bacillota bacterium]
MGKAYDEGLRAEEMAAQYLKNKHYEILENRFRCRQGEIDLIALDQDQDLPVLVFVEVKYRHDLSFGRPSLAVTPEKMKKLIHTAEYYRSFKQIGEIRMRFDIVEIWWAGDHHKIHHYQNAFGEDLWMN